uniref:Unconventional myosin-IXa-like n=1 Tax=Sinocyclocheilus grahami TaxID=75366 RepID=A0A672SL03_SINGR
MSCHDAGGRRRYEDSEFTLRVYPGALSEGTIYCPVSARKVTSAAEVIERVIERLQLDRARLYVLAEVKEFGGEEWILNPCDCPVQRMMLWPRMALENRLAGEDYRFLLREKDLDGSICYGNLQMWLRVTEERRRMVERGLLPQPPYVDDLCALPDLNERTLLENLRGRFRQEKIYTYVGGILIVVNPFKFLPIYNPKYVKMYDKQRLGKLEPHIYAVADVAYHAMLQRRRNQCIVISGESGSGKTQSTNFLIHHLTALSQKGFASGVEQIILGAGPVLEAFGNAKTAHNNNSSRFGKFIQVNYQESGTVRGERQMSMSAALNCLSAFQITKKVHRQHWGNYCETELDCFTVEGEDLKHDFERLQLAMEMVGFLPTTRKQIFSLLSAILLLGNIRYKKKTYRDDSIDICNPEVLPIISELLEVKEEMLFEALTTRKTVTVGERLIVPYKLAEAGTVRDSMAKSLYGALFDWIVFRTNHALLYNKDLEDSDKILSIGVLDIFGFEDYENNSFEQFCINFANETLQHYFNQHVFKLEQEEYRSEGISWHMIDYIDNTACINLISKKPTALLHLLDEECNFPQASNQTLLDKFKRQHEGNGYIEFPAVMEPAFIIRHYAGKVKYSVKDFREKNTDHMRPDIVALLKSSRNAFICGLMGIDPVATFRWAVVRAYFRALVAFREAGKRHKEKTTTTSSDGPVQNQKSVDSFSFLHHPVHQRSLEILQRCKDDKYNSSISRRSPRTPLSDLQGTNTRRENMTLCVCVSQVFLRERLRQRLQEQLHQEVLRRIVCLQRSFRTQQERRRFCRQRQAAQLIQRWWRACLTRADAELQQGAALRLQAAWRGFRERRLFLRRRRAALIIQTRWRRVLQMQHSAARLIQSVWRSLRQRHSFLQQRRAAVTLQAACRGQRERHRSARRKRRKLNNKYFLDLSNIYLCENTVSKSLHAQQNPPEVQEERGEPLRSVDGSTLKSRSKRQSRRQRELQQATFSLELLKVRSASVDDALPAPSPLSRHLPSESQGSFELLGCPEPEPMEENQSSLASFKPHFYIADEDSSPLKQAREKKESVVVIIRMQKEIPVDQSSLEALQKHETMDAEEIGSSSPDPQTIAACSSKPLHDLEAEDSQKDTPVDVVFKKALKEFRLNIFNSYSTALAMDDGRSIRYKDLYALFEHILEKNMRLEQRDWSESPVKVWVNTFKVFLDEFMTEYKPMNGTITKAPKPERKKRRKKESDTVEEHMGHIFKSTQYSIPTYCEFCSSLIWIMDKACVCKLCRYACHRKCCLRMTTTCSKKFDPELSSRQFGVELSRLTSDERAVPLVVEKLINYIEMHGLYTEGIYRKSGSTNKIKELKQGLDTDANSVNLDDYNIHVIASVLKQWLRDLPNPLMTFELYEEFLRAMGLQDKGEVVQGVYSVIDQLSRTHLSTLERLIFHLVRISFQEETNRMSANALAIVFAPCILRCPDTTDPLQSVRDIGKTTACVELIICEQMRKYKARLKDINTLEFAENKAKSRLTHIRRSLGKARLRKSGRHTPSPPLSPRAEREEPGEEGAEPGLSEQQQAAMQQEENVLTQQIENLQKEKEELTYEMLALDPRASDDEMLESEASIGTADSSENLMESEGAASDQWEKSPGASSATRWRKSESKSRRGLRRQPESLDSVDSVSSTPHYRFRSSSSGPLFSAASPGDLHILPDQEGSEQASLTTRCASSSEKTHPRPRGNRSCPPKPREPGEGGSGGRRREHDFSSSQPLVLYGSNEFMV